VRLALSGSIPACAGEPMSGCSSPRRQRVYPRVCGGAPEPTPVTVIGGGLSPRVRGSHGADVVLHLVVGSIPACAGEPLPGVREIGVVRVYPRVCGGADIREIAEMQAQGLSPRVRGSRWRVT